MSVRVFVSSPSDVPAERKAVERVAARVAGRYDHLEIDVYRWEANHYFSAHTGFQEQIEEIGGFDLVVGILWSRLGSPLPKGFGKTMPAPRDGAPYPSGTAFEILEAIQIRRQRGNPPPDILVYRKTAPTPSAAADDDIEQERLLAERKAVNAFFEDFFASEETGFRAAFTGVADLERFEEQFEADLEAWLRENRSLGRPRKWRVEERGTPFRGLDPFDAGHREVFFGRRAEIERAQDRLTTGSGFLLVDGASGTGKSSLVRAGLLPRLQDLDPDLRVAVTRPETTAPMEALCQALFAEGALPELAESDFPEPAALARHFLNGGDVAPVRRALERAQAATDGPARPTRLVVLVDQCEALFTDQVPADEQAVYGAILEGLIASGQVQVVATLRGNAREAALAVPPFERLINAAPGLSLGPPAPDAFGEIVRGPAEAAGLAFERNGEGVGLDEVLLDEVARDPDALPLLQFALDQLYARAAGRVADVGDQLGDVPDGDPILTLTHADYKALGGLSGAIGAQAEAALTKVSPAARKRLAPLVRELTVAGRGEAVLGRAPTDVAAPDAESRALVDALIDARILLRNALPPKEGAPKIDELRFTHERVLKAWDRAREAVEAAAQYLRVRGDLVRAEARWRDGGTPRDLLLPAGLRLAEAEDVLRDFGPELDRRYPQLCGYIQTSGRLARRRQRLSQAAAAIFAVVAVAAGWFGYQSQQNAELAAANQRTAEENAVRAEENATRAEQNAARAEAEAERAEESAAEADAQRQTAEAETRRAESRLSALQRFKSDELATSAFEALEAGRYDDALLLSISSAGPEAEDWSQSALSSSALTASVLQASHNFSTPIATLRGHKGTVVGGLLTRDASTAVTWSLDGAARVWETESGVLRHIFEHGTPVLSASLVGDDKVATSGTGQTAIVWNTNTGEKLFEIKHPAPLSVNSYNSDTDTLITGDFGGNVYVTSIATGSSEASFHLPNAVRALSLSPDKRTVLVAGGTLALLDSTTLIPLAEFGSIEEDTQTRFDRAEFIEETGLFAAWSSSGHIVIFATENGEVVAEHNFETAVFGMLPFVEDGVIVFWTGAGIYSVSLETGASSTLVEIEDEDALTAVARVPGFPWIVWVSLGSELNAISLDGGLDGSLKIDAAVLSIRAGRQDGRFLVSLRNNVSQVISADPDDRQGRKDKIRMIRLAAMEHDGLARRLTSTQTLALSGGDDGSMRIWQQQRGGAELGRQTHSGVYRGFDFSNNKIVSWAQDPLAKIWSWVPNPQFTIVHKFPSPITNEYVSQIHNLVVGFDQAGSIWLSNLGVEEPAVELQPGFGATSVIFDPDAPRFFVFSDDQYSLCSTLNTSCSEAVLVTERIISMFWARSGPLLLDDNGVITAIDTNTSERREVLKLGSEPKTLQIAEQPASKAEIFLGNERAVLLSQGIASDWIELPLTSLQTSLGFAGSFRISPWMNYLFIKLGANGGRLIAVDGSEVTDFPDLEQLSLQAEFISHSQMVLGDSSGGIWLVDLASGHIEKVYSTGGAVKAIAALGESSEFAVIAGEPTAEIGIIFESTGKPRAFFVAGEGQNSLVASEQRLIAYSTQSRSLTIVDAANGRQLLRTFSTSSYPNLLPNDRLVTRRYDTEVHEVTLTVGRDTLLETAQMMAANLASLDNLVSCQITAFSPDECENKVSEHDLALLEDEEALSGDETGIGNMIDVMPNPVRNSNRNGSSIDVEIATNAKGKAVFFHNSEFSDIPAYFYIQGNEGRMGVVMPDGLVRSFGLSIGKDVIKFMQNTREILTVFLDPQTGVATEGLYVPVRRLQ